VSDDQDGVGESESGPVGHVRISSSTRGEAWSVSVHVGASLEEIESARAIAREIADRLAGGAASATEGRRVAGGAGAA